MPISLSIFVIASSTSASTNLSGRWSLISCSVRKPRLLPSFTRLANSMRRFSASASVSVVMSRPNSRISARSLDLGTLMRSGLAFGADSAAMGAGAAGRVVLAFIRVLVGEVGQSWAGPDAPTLDWTSNEACLPD